MLDKKHTLPDDSRNKAELEGRHILLAEDMEINADIMTEVLSMRKIETDHAVNGKEAVHLYESKPEGYYDAILMDMRMPEMDGLEATRVIRSLGRGDSETIPIIALTANAFDEDVQQSLQAGLDAHLSLLSRISCLRPWRNSSAEEVKNNKIRYKDPAQGGIFACVQVRVFEKKLHI